MATSGKHIAKNNSKVSGKTIIASAELLALLVSISIGTKVAINAFDNMEEKKEQRRIEATEFAESFDFETLYNGIVSQYKIYQSNGNLNTVGKVFQYFHDKIVNTNLSEKEKIDLLQTYLNDSHTFEEIIEYLNTDTKAVIYEEINIENNNINVVINNQELMAQIHEASAAYQVPEAILVGLIADKVMEGKISQQAIAQSYHTDWNKLDSNRSAHNYTTGRDDQLKGWNGPNSVMHLAAVLANSIKEEDADLYKAIIGVKIGPKNMNTEYGNAYDEVANRILSYASCYLSDKRFSLDYNSVVEGRTLSTTFESSKYQEYLTSVINSVINILDTEMIQYYDNGVSLH